MELFILPKQNCNLWGLVNWIKTNKRKRHWLKIRCYLHTRTKSTGSHWKKKTRERVLTTGQSTLPRYTWSSKAWHEQHKETQLASLTQWTSNSAQLFPKPLTYPFPGGRGHECSLTLKLSTKPLDITLLVSNDNPTFLASSTWSYLIAEYI